MLSLFWQLVRQTPKEIYLNAAFQKGGLAYALIWEEEVKRDTKEVRM